MGDLRVFQTSDLRNAVPARDPFNKKLADAVSVERPLAAYGRLIDITVYNLGVSGCIFKLIVIFRLVSQVGSDTDKPRVKHFAAVAFVILIPVIIILAVGDIVLIVCHVLK